MKKVNLLRAIFIIATTVIGIIHAAKTVNEKLRDDPDLSEFYELLEASRVANNTLAYRHVTVFAPMNRAFQNYKETLPSNLVLYHMANLPQKIQDLSDQISSELEGNPPLWITRRHGTRGEEVYVNNARIIKERSNFESRIKVGEDSKTQVLHVISEVLEPVVSISPETPIYKPHAFQFLNQSENLNMGKHRIRLFRQRIQQENKGSIFKAEGRYTFFIPVDEGFKPEPRPTLIDRVVIDGHVIPNQVLFTAPTPENVPYQTLSFTDNLKVTISFTKAANKTVYVKSNTLVGDANHPTGVVLAEIVKANIPVRNGVVHLIQRPLMVVDTTVKGFLEENVNGPVYKFYETLRDYGEDTMNMISSYRDVTLFAPSNAAFEASGVENILQDKKRLREILRLHFVKERLPIDKIKNRTISQVPTANEKKKLFFNVFQDATGNSTVTVECSGVNATIITANIAATNGIIHIIDRVLGVPYTTVLEKLQTDPMLNSTYFLGQRHEFNKQLSDTTKRFTYFVPYDQAWRIAGINYPSATKKLFMPDFGYHAKQILERHLVVADQAYTMAKLKEMSYTNDSVILTSTRDLLKLRVKETGESYSIEWEGKPIKVFRPDVECTNGIIHVIDSVFLKDSDIRVTGGASYPTFVLIPHLLMFFIAKWLL